jgi:HlyD family secretion protein
LEEREENEPLSKTWLFRIAIIAVAAAAVFVAWQSLKPEGLPDGFASSNGRIEATEIDVAAKIAGRVEEIMVDEGDFVEAGQVLARMDTDVLQAERREAEAELARAQISIETAKSLVTQREAEKAAAQASVAQQEAELVAAQRRLERTESAAPGGAVALTQVDEDRARAAGARAAVSAAEPQVAAAEAAVNTAPSRCSWRAPPCTCSPPPRWAFSWARSPARCRS